MKMKRNNDKVSGRINFRTKTFSVLVNSVIAILFMVLCLIATRKSHSQESYIYTCMLFYNTRRFYCALSVCWGRGNTFRTIDQME